MNLSDFIDNNNKSGLLNRVKRLYERLASHKSIILDTISATNYSILVSERILDSYRGLRSAYHNAIRSTMSSFVSSKYGNIGKRGNYAFSIARDMYMLGMKFTVPRYSIDVRSSSDNVGDTDIIICTLNPTPKIFNQISGHLSQVAVTPYIKSEKLFIYATKNETSSSPATFSVTGDIISDIDMPLPQDYDGSGINRSVNQIIASSGNLVNNASFEEYKESGDNAGFKDWYFYNQSTWTERKIYYTRNASSLGQTSMVFSKSSLNEDGDPEYAIFTNIRKLKPYSVYLVLFDAVAYVASQSAPASIEQASLTISIKPSNSVLYKDVSRSPFTLLPARFFGALKRFAFGSHDEDTIHVSNLMSDFKTMSYVFITDETVTTEDNYIVEIAVDYGEGESVTTFPVLIDRFVIAEMEQLYAGGPYIAIVGSKCRPGNQLNNGIRLRDSFEVDIRLTNRTDDMKWYEIFDILNTDNNIFYPPMGDEYNVTWSGVLT